MPLPLIEARLYDELTALDPVWSSAYLHLAQAQAPFKELPEGRRAIILILESSMPGPELPM